MIVTKLAPFAKIDRKTRKKFTQIRQSCDALAKDSKEGLVD